MKTIRILLVLVIIGGSLLRFWSLSWGWPFALYGDEGYYMPNALRMAADRNLNPGAFHNSHLFTYICLGEVGASYCIGRFVCVFPDAKLFGSFVWTHSICYLTMARLTIALFGIFTIWNVYLIGARLFNKRVGVIAALVMSVSPLHVFYSKVAVNDVCMVFFVSLTLYTSADLFKTFSWRSVMLSGLFTGLSVGAKYNAGIVALVPITALVYHYYTKQSPPSSDFLSNSPSSITSQMSIYFVASIAAFILSNPFCVFDFPAFWEGFTRQLAYGRQPWPTQPPGAVPLLMMDSLLSGIGPLSCFAAVAGGSFMLYYDWRRAILITLFPILYCLFMGNQKLFFARFMLPIYPSLAVCAAFGIDRLTAIAYGRFWNASLQSPMKTRAAERFLLVTIIGAVIALPFWDSVQHNAVLSKKNTRLRVRDWVVNHVPSGSRVLADFDAAAALGPAFGDKLPFRLISDSTVRVVNDWNLQKLEREKIEFVFISSNLLSLFAWDPIRRENVAEFAKQVESHSDLVTAFSPTDGSDINYPNYNASGDIVSTLYPAIAGPLIRVYRLHPSVKSE